MFMSFEIRDTRQGQVRKTRGTQCTNINGAACACAKQEIVPELFCIPVATASTVKLTVSTKEHSSHARDAV